MASSKNSKTNSRLTNLLFELGMPDFKFQQFSIDDDLCGMKIGTDGILLGAWANCKSANRILDVGTGCGLIALMLAQRTQGQSENECELVGIELSSSAANKAEENKSKSPWADRVKIEHGMLQVFPTSDLAQSKFDLVVCNPPFFTADPKSSHDRALARQSLSLSKNELFEVASKLLTERGIVSVIYPFDQREETIKAAAEFKLHPIRETQVRTLPDQPFKRVLLEFGNKPTDEIQQTELTIESVHHQYTPEFEALTSEFYLRFA